MKKRHFCIIGIALYALLYRVFVEFDILEINSVVYMFVIPGISGFLPIIIDKEAFIESKNRTIVYPLVGVFVFLMIAFFSRLEDLGCFIILLFPYGVFSVLFSLLIRYFVRQSKEGEQKNISRNSMFLLVLPLFVGNIEKNIEKNVQTFEVSNKIVINHSKEEVWSNLFSVPELTGNIDNSVYNYFGFPNPKKSTFYKDKNIRLGYFSNGIILNEKVSEMKVYEKLTFQIDVEKSELSKSQTFKHILKNKNLVFDSITYKLIEISPSKTELSLVCNYKIKSNIPYYGEFWSKEIISDFENKLLKALKTTIELKH